MGTDCRLLRIKHKQEGRESTKILFNKWKNVLGLFLTQKQLPKLLSNVYNKLNNKHVHDSKLFSTKSIYVILSLSLFSNGNPNL